MVLNIDHFSVENHKPQKRIQLYKLPSLTHYFYRDWPSADDFIFVIILRAVFHARATDFSCLIDFFLLFLISRCQSSPQQTSYSPRVHVCCESQNPQENSRDPLQSTSNSAAGLGPRGPEGFPSIHCFFTPTSTVKPQQRLFTVQRKEEETTRKFQVAAESKQQCLFWSNRFLVDENLEHKLHQKNSEKHLFR